MVWNPFRRRTETKETVRPVNAVPFPPSLGLFMQPGEISPRQSWVLYENVATLAKVIDLIADNVAKLEPMLSINGEVIQRDNRMYSDMFDLLSAPGFNRDRRMLIKELAIQRLVTGTAYLGVIGNPQYLPNVLDVFKSWLVAPVNTSGLWPERYGYAEGSASIQFQLVPGRDFRWLGPMAEIVPIYDMDGMQRGVGLSRLSAIKLDVELRLRGTEHNISVMEQGARPSGALTFKDSLTPAQADAVGASLSSMTGPSGAGKVLVLQGGEATFLAMSQNAKDMDWANLLKMVEDSIVARFNVPTTLYNVSAQTDNNYETAWTAFYDNAVLPEFQVIWGGIARMLSIRLQQNVTIKHNAITNNVLMKQAIEQARTLHAEKLVSTNEARLIIGYEPVIGGDVMYGSGGDVPVGLDYFTDHMAAIDQLGTDPGASTVMLPGTPRFQQPENGPNDREQAP